MFVRRSFLPLAYSLPFLAPDGDTSTGGDGQKTSTSEVTFDEAQQQKLNALLAAEKKSTEERVRAELAAESAAAKKKADEDREREEATKRGEFDKVRTSLERERDTATGERDTYKAQVEFLSAHFEAEFTARAAKVDKSFEPFKPAADAPLQERLDWLTKAEAGTASLPTTTNTGNRPNPNAADASAEYEAQYDRMRRSGRFTI